MEQDLITETREQTVASPNRSKPDNGTVWVEFENDLVLNTEQFRAHNDVVIFLIN